MSAACALCDYTGQGLDHAPGCLALEHWIETALAAARAAQAAHPGRWRPAARSMVVTDDYQLVLRGEPAAVVLASIMDPATVIALVEGWRAGRASGPRAAEARPVARRSQNAPPPAPGGDEDPST